MRKIVSILLIAVFLSFGVCASAKQEKNYVFKFRNGVEVVAENNSELSYEQLAKIAESLASDRSNQSKQSKKPVLRLNPSCAAGNHAITKTRFRVTEHYVYSSSPKCVKKTYEVESCTRIGCYYHMERLVSSYRVSTCHG